MYVYTSGCAYHNKKCLALDISEDMGQYDSIPWMRFVIWFDLIGFDWMAGDDCTLFGVLKEVAEFTNKSIGRLEGRR